MLSTIKRRLYFLVASYFGFWARIFLKRWRAQVVVITGSSGKTTVLHMVEAQVGDQAIYSHHANSAVGVPFHILGMNPNVSSPLEWLIRPLTAPLSCLRPVPKTKLYIVEADCDRVKEGRFLANLLKPEVVLWVTVSRTHSMGFERQVKSGQFESHEAAIAHEFGYFVAAAQKLVVVNGDQSQMMTQLSRVQNGVKTEAVKLEAVTQYELLPAQTKFTINGRSYTMPGLQPKAVGASIQMVNKLLDYLKLPHDPSYAKLEMPPGRSQVFAGKQGTTIIDSTYNTGLGATTEMLNLFQQYPAKTKWLVIGDILEQGSVEADEHKRLAAAIAEVNAQQVILLGRRTHKYTWPELKTNLPTTPIHSYESPKDVLSFLQQNLKGGEVILFKGAQGLEGVIDQLLDDPADAEKLVRRGVTWTRRRQAWGLPR